MKFTYTLTLARKIFLIFLAFVIALSVAAIFVRDSISERLDEVNRLARNMDSDQAKPQQTLLLLQQAEDDFQQSLVNPDSAKSSKYKLKIKTAIDQIDTLLNSNKDHLSPKIAENGNIKKLYRQKLLLSGKLVTLRHRFDSLLTIYSAFDDELVGIRAPKLATVIKKPEKELESNTDTLKTVATPQKKGLFGRIKDAISNKSTPVKEVIVIKQDSETSTSSVATQHLIDSGRDSFARQLKQLHEKNAKMLTMQRQLIALNSTINKELGIIILELKDINYKVADELKTVALKNYSETNTLLNKLYLAALLIVIVFAALLIFFIIKLNKSEVYLKAENERSVNIARQKTDLLLHLSHEIRNPLTAIKGFLHIFGKTPLNERQREMLESITGSSDMLLITLNDTLDAVKMESSEFKIHNEPFVPDQIIRQLVEGMSYSALKKKLYLSYDFEGDPQTMVTGDSFRLKQILANLLSNAIKYTNNGGIKVRARMESSGLQVDITDTGMGISPEQQINLFSKYYQTSSSRGQVGTGLGLYICRQLVELQRGKITVKSVPGSGSTFSFFIPYQQSKPEPLHTPEDVIPLLNGLTVLAVDDNEISLLLLNAMMGKWNVKFQGAPSAEAALDIIEAKNIDVVLTDIQLPGMSGTDLLKKIRMLKASLNQLPVIAVSGTSDKDGEKTYEQKGFAGFVYKPFTEKDLLKELAKVLLKNN